MTNQELIACIQAEERGEVVEYKHALSADAKWITKEPSTRWDSYEFAYRIRREPRKCWVKFIDDGTLGCIHFNKIDNLKAWESKGWQLVTEEIK